MAGLFRSVEVFVLRIRSARETDIPEVVEIERASFADPWSADSFLTSLRPERMHFLVAEESAGDALVIGYVIALMIGEEAEIADLAVTPHARRRGVGPMLLDRVASDLTSSGVRTLFLEVRESNVSAQRLYASRSFKPVGRRPRYYQSPVEDALILRRDLAPT